MVNKIADQNTLEDMEAIQKANVKACDSIKVSLSKDKVDKTLTAELTQCTAWNT